MHLVALPMFERHTSQKLYEMIVKFMDALYIAWRKKLLGMTTDGENVMTGRHSGLVTRIVACAENRVIRVWCAPHQIDIVVKATADAIDGGKWVQMAYSLSIGVPTRASEFDHPHGSQVPKENKSLDALGSGAKFLSIRQTAARSSSTSKRRAATSTCQPTLGG